MLSLTSCNLRKTWRRNLTIQLKVQYASWRLVREGGAVRLRGVQGEDIHLSRCLTPPTWCSLPLHWNGLADVIVLTLPCGLNLFFFLLCSIPPHSLLVLRAEPGEWCYLSTLHFCFQTVMWLTPHKFPPARHTACCLYPQVSSRCLKYLGPWIWGLALCPWWPPRLFPMSRWVTSPASGLTVSSSSLLEQPTWTNPLVELKDPELLFSDNDFYLFLSPSLCTCSTTAFQFLVPQLFLILPMPQSPLASLFPYSGWTSWSTISLFLETPFFLLTLISFFQEPSHFPISA